MQLRIFRSRIEELRIPPGNRLEQLSGNLAGQWSIRINDQWRICFNWQDSKAMDVEIVDYHQENRMSIPREKLNTLKFGNVVSGEKLAPFIPAKCLKKNS